eukprot:2663379-Rhodomonas_salina.2
MLPPLILDLGQIFREPQGKSSSNFSQQQRGLDLSAASIAIFLELPPDVAWSAMLSPISHLRSRIFHLRSRTFHLSPPIANLPSCISLRSLHWLHRHLSPQECGTLNTNTSSLWAHALHTNSSSAGLRCAVCDAPC